MPKKKRVKYDVWGCEVSRMQMWNTPANAFEFGSHISFPPRRLYTTKNEANAIAWMVAHRIENPGEIVHYEIKRRKYVPS